MLFLSNRTRNTAFSTGNMRDRSFTHKFGHSCIIFGCLSVIIGLILIIVGVISDIDNAKFVGIGIISMGIGLFLFTFVCYYGKLDKCYNNWAYRSRVLPGNLETPQPLPTAVVSISPFIQSSVPNQKRQSIVPIETVPPLTAITAVDIHKLIVSPSIKLDTTTTTSDNVT